MVSFDILSKKQITVVPIRLHGCTGWSAPLLFANPDDRVSCIEAKIMKDWFEFSRFSSNYKLLMVMQSLIELQVTIQSRDKLPLYFKTITAE